MDWTQDMAAEVQSLFATPVAAARAYHDHLQQLQEQGETLVFGSQADPAAPHAEVHVHDSDLYRRILTGGGIAAGETYIEGLWSSPDLTAVTRAFSANLAMLGSMSDRQNLLAKTALRLSHWARRNTSRRSRENISAHYDLGNDFYRECGDVFAAHAIDNPDPASEVSLLTAYGAPAMAKRLAARGIVANTLVEAKGHKAELAALQSECAALRVPEEGGCTEGAQAEEHTG